MESIGGILVCGVVLFGLYLAYMLIFLPTNVDHIREDVATIKELLEKAAKDQENGKPGKASDHETDPGKVRRMRL